MPKTVRQQVPRPEGQPVTERACRRCQRQRVACTNQRQLAGEPVGLSPLLQGFDVSSEILFVATQQLVRALSVQKHGYTLLLGEPKYAPLRELAGTAHRQLVEPHEVRQVRYESINRRLDHVADDPRESATTCCAYSHSSAGVPGNRPVNVL